MSRFAARRALQVDTIFAEFGDPAALLQTAAGSSDTVRAIIRRPSDADPLQDVQFVRAKPFGRIPFADAPSLSDRDVILSEGLRWQIAGAPTRPGDGAIWQFELSGGGLA